MKLTVFQRAKIIQAQDRAGEALQDVLAPGSLGDGEVASKLRVAIKMLEQCLEIDACIPPVRFVEGSPNPDLVLNFGHHYVLKGRTTSPDAVSVVSDKGDSR